MANQFEHLDAQDETSRFAQFTPEEHSEYQDWLSQVAMARDSAGEPTPIDTDGSGRSND